uniref:Uncharacterized protein n=1 Tax=Triticum urartu TaxID=4572 RepID=A0A8R7PW65_TRIUA
MSVAAADWLPAATVMASGRPVLSAGEIERHLLPLVDLEPEENPRLAPLRGCLLVLTSHRLVFLHEASLSARALPLASIIHTYPPHPQAQPQPTPLPLLLLVLLVVVASPAHPHPDLPAPVAVGGRRRRRHLQGGRGCVLREAARGHPREGLGGDRLGCSGQWRPGG